MHRLSLLILLLFLAGCATAPAPDRINLPQWQYSEP